MDNKQCYNCSFYGQLVNQGLWFCNKSHKEMNAEECPDYDEQIDNGVLSSASTDIIYNDIKSPNNMLIYKLLRAKRNKKKNRGVKHWRRK